MVDPSDIDAAAARIRGRVRVTPTIVLEDGLGLGFPLELKLEHLQHTGTFKTRGAFNTLLTGPVPEAGIVAASGGNHGAAVAFAAARLGIPARIFVPAIAGPSKIGLIRRAGADLVVTEGAYADAYQASRAYQAETGALEVHAYDGPGTVAGQGTVAREWETQGMEADTVLIAVGGGGLIGGAIAWFAGRRRVVAVEPERAPTLARALQDGPDAEVEVGGIAANSLGARRIGQVAHSLATRHGVESVTVPDDAIAEARDLLWRELRLLVEPAGACALAALTSGAWRPQAGERVAVLVCGANPAPDPLDG
ncbi:MAG: threonine/serine dehydratase [Pseudomonadota bacterium]